MEGLIPFVYRVIVQYRNGEEGPLSSWFSAESPSASPYYIRLPGDSGRYEEADTRIFSLKNQNISATTNSSKNVSPSFNTVSKGAQSPLHH